MIKKLKCIVVTIAAMAFAVVPVLSMSPVVQAADINGSLCQGTDLNITTNGGSTANCTSGVGTNGINTLLAQAVNIFSAVVGVIAVIMIIVGGLRYITSGGEASKVGGAKTTILYALVGLVIVALAQLIVHFVLGQASSVTSGG